MDNVGKLSGWQPIERLEFEGLQVVVPLGWEARISKRVLIDDQSERFPIVHAATVPLPAERGDYGSNVVEKLSAEDVFIALIEFGPEAADTELFTTTNEIREVAAEELHPRQLQRLIPGQAGAQRFFTYRNRPFCLYVVIGSYLLRADLTAKANNLVRGLTVDQSDASGGSN